LYPQTTTDDRPTEATAATGYSGVKLGNQDALLPVANTQDIYDLLSLV